MGYLLFGELPLYVSVCVLARLTKPLKVVLNALVEGRTQFVPDQIPKKIENGVRLIKLIQELKGSQLRSSTRVTDS